MPPTPAGPSIQGPVTATVTVTVTQAPPALTALRSDAVLNATVTQAARPGQPVSLDTPMGPMAVRTSQPLGLAAGTTLTLHLQTPGRDQAVFRLASVNGRPLAGAGLGGAGALGAGGQTAAPARPGVSAGMRSPLDAVSVAGRDGGAGQRGMMTATVIRAVGAGVPGAGAVGNGLPVGTRLSVRLLSLQASGATGGGASSSGIAGTAGTAPDGGARSANQAAQTGGAGEASDASGKPLGRFSAAVWRGVGQLAQAATGPNSTAVGTGPAGMGGGVGAANTGSAAPGTLTGTLMPGAPAGQSLLGTSAGTLSLPLRLDAPPGSQITLTVVSSTPPAPGPASAPALASLPQGGSAGWPALTETLDTLSRVDPAAARALEATVPRPGPQLAFAMVNVASALRAGGDLRQWPGESTARALERLGPQGARLAGALKGDISDLAGQVRESRGGEWRAMTLPLADQAEISAITLIVRVPGGNGETDGEGDGEGGEGRADPGQRFLVDVTLSELGRIQIDGLMQSRVRRLQLILRTSTPLPETVCRDLQVIAETSMGAFGLEGALSFRAGEAFLDPVPAEEATLTSPPPGGLIA